MKTTIKLFLILLVSIVMWSCDREDPGPLQDATEEYTVIDFDKVEIGDGLNVRVEQSNTFLIRAEGDIRNINDLEVFKSGNTLVIRFDEDGNRRHQTYITIGMPALNSFNFSGGSVSVVSGFESDGILHGILSGGSVSQIDAGYRQVDLTISGGSVMKLHGLGDDLFADISGASILSAFDFPVGQARLKASGASIARVMVSDELSVDASGASEISYRGTPEVQTTVSGGSSVEKD